MNIEVLTLSQLEPYLSKVATMGDLKDVEFNLNIPLYVEKVIEENLPSVEKSMAELNKAWKVSLEAEEKFKSVLKGFL